MSALSEYLKEHLNGGKSAEDIADFLRQKGIKGLRGNSRDCPIANLLKQELGLDAVSVGPESVALQELAPCEYSLTCTMSHRKTVEHVDLEGEDWRGFSSFIHQFDDGGFSDLNVEEAS